MSTRLEDKTALVTGATSNIGRAIATAFAAEGAHVIVSGRSRQRGAEVVEQIRAAGGHAEFIAADLDGSAYASQALAVDASKGVRRTDRRVCACHHEPCAAADERRNERCSPPSSLTPTSSRTSSSLAPSARLCADLPGEAKEHLAPHLDGDVGRVPGQVEAGGRAVAGDEDDVVAAEHLVWGDRGSRAGSRYSSGHLRGHTAT